ncbi:hypothetical protein Esi_0297_0002 [Ectocarpus siliculosus]|uniref:Uncharacterized protein n=1 Tax=Ectocarpus siliculosus TaxID=2880 RepID=D7FVN1_ECTSI|nr:hypothetical protein Esi_0297_0002 [Ectocarpus siliculosus]|eukprot:CBJ31952.1 hypothetical protein Esi_0297_0002 [Ectocarpus siliculosus]
MARPCGKILSRGVERREKTIGPRFGKSCCRSRATGFLKHEAMSQGGAGRGVDLRNQNRQMTAVQSERWAADKLLRGSRRKRVTLALG